jgi:pimeloyl-ACP methyl ester carboxylesterase
MRITDCMGKLDLDHVGLAGHSYGANTTQGPHGPGFSPEGNLQRTRVLMRFFPCRRRHPAAMSPEKAFGKISAPVLCMTGTKDNNPVSPTMTPESRQLVYKGLP